MSFVNIPVPHATGLGYHFTIRPPAAFARGFLRSWGELPDKIRARGAAVCPRAMFDAGRLGPMGQWRVSYVFIPHESVPFGEEEAAEFAARIVAAVEGAAA